MITMNDHTEAQPTIAQDVPTQADRAQLAWAQEEPATEHLPPRRPWRSAWARAALLVLCGSISGVAVWLVGWHPTHPTPHPATTLPTTMLLPTAAPQPPAPPPAPATPAPTQADPLTPNDHRFLAQLDRDGLGQRNPGTEGAAVATAEAICRAFNQGDTFTHVQTVMAAQYLTPAQAEAYIQNAVAFYCPHAMGNQ